MKKRNIAQENNVTGNNRILSETKIKGELTSQSDIRIDGYLEGGIETTGKLVIGKTGFVTGTILCENADIEGTAEGNIKITNLLNLKSTARVSGDVQVSKLSIEPGAVINANCSMDDKKQNNEKIDTKQKSS